MTGFLSGALPPLPVAVPLAVAGVLLLCNRLLPGRVPDIVALLAALFAAATSALLLRDAAAGPITYWFGGWSPHDGQVIGIAFVIGQAGALLALFTAALTALTLVFAWGFFADTGTEFHAMMLVFMAAMIGFGLTHDLFNMFVWFEAMSVTAFALTAYALNASSLEGALTFTVTNGIGSFLMLGGIGLLYLPAQALDFGALETYVRGAPNSPVVAAAFCMIAAALLIKGAMVPLHFWLSDAHAVAPSPLSVMFSGIMVPLGLFGLMRLVWTVFLPAPDVQRLVHSLLPWLGALTAILGGLAALGQRHIKRMLAFSTVSHMGVLVMALALVTPVGVSGFLAYLIGHGMVKAALFMVAGILLARLGSADAIALRGKGRALWPAGVAFGLGGLLLGGMPVGVMDEGAGLIDAAATATGHAWIVAPLVMGTALTGAAVLRATGRVFAGLGARPGEEAGAPHENEREPEDRPLWLMLAPALVLLGAALVWSEGVREVARTSAHGFLAVAGLADTEVPLPEPPHPFVPWLSLGMTLVIAAYDLGRSAVPARVAGVVEWLGRPVFTLVTRLHSGIVGDYVAWITAGVALFVAVLGLG
jgi:multicomponent Na+:H+ antiporter subunit D